MKFDLSKAYLAASAAAKKYCPEHLFDDIVQEIVLEAWLLSLKGYNFSKRVYKWLAHKALDKLIGCKKASRGRRENLFVPLNTDCSIDPPDLAGLALLEIRLEKAWETLTTEEKFGLKWLKGDESMSYISAKHNIPKATLWRTCKRLERTIQ